MHRFLQGKIGFIMEAKTTPGHFKKSLPVPWGRGNSKRTLSPPQGPTNAFWGHFGSVGRVSGRPGVCFTKLFLKLQSLTNVSKTRWLSAVRDAKYRKFYKKTRGLRQKSKKSRKSKKTYDFFAIFCLLERGSFTAAPFNRMHSAIRRSKVATVRLITLVGSALNSSTHRSANFSRQSGGFFSQTFFSTIDQIVSIGERSQLRGGHLGVSILIPLRSIHFSHVV